MGLGLRVSLRVLGGSAVDISRTIIGLIRFCGVDCR